MIHHEVMYHIVRAGHPLIYAKEPPQNSYAIFEKLKSSMEKNERKKNMRETLTGFYKFNIVCYDEEGMNEIEYLYDNYVKPQLTDKQEIRMTRGLSRISLTIVYRNEISEKIFESIFYVLSNWAIVAKREIIGTIELNMWKWGKDEWFDAEYLLRCCMN